MAKKVKYDFNPIEGVRFKSPRRKSRVLRDIADFVLESVLQDVGESRSPVTGRAFKGLSKEYKKKKQEEGLEGVPNLEFEGDLLDSVRVVRKGENALRLEVDASQNAKADGHNNHSGKSNLPPRKFIPNADAEERLRPSIRKGIADIIRRAKEEESGR